MQIGANIQTADNNLRNANTQAERDRINAEIQKSRDEEARAKTELLEKTRQIRDCEDGIDRRRREIENLRDDQNRDRAEISRLSDEINELNRKLGELQAENESLRSIMPSLQNQIDDLTAKLGGGDNSGLPGPRQPISRPTYSSPQREGVWKCLWININDDRDNIYNFRWGGSAGLAPNFLSSSLIQLKNIEEAEKFLKFLRSGEIYVVNQLGLQSNNTRDCRDRVKERIRNALTRFEAGDTIEDVWNLW